MMTFSIKCPQITLKCLKRWVFNNVMLCRLIIFTVLFCNDKVWPRIPFQASFQLCLWMHSKSSWMSSNLFSLIYKEVIHRFLLCENGEPKVRRLIRVHIVLQFKGQKPLNHWFEYVKTQVGYKYAKWIKLCANRL